MSEEIILIEEIIGKTITDIRCKYGIEDGWLDTAECYIELDRKIFIEIPYGQTNGFYETEVDADAKTIFSDLSDIPSYLVNKEGKSIAEIVEIQKKRKRSLINRVKKILFGYEPPIKEYIPYKVEYYENKLKYIINRKIVDYLWETDQSEKGIFELDNVYLISEKYMVPSGTGLAGLHYYDSLESLKKRRGENIKRYSDLRKSDG